MNEERRNETLAPKPITRRTIFPTEPRTDLHHHQQTSFESENHNKKSSSSSTVTIERHSLHASPSSSSSSSPRSSPPPQPLQSFTSDTSVIDTHWIEQQRQRDAHIHRVPPSTLCDRPMSRQVETIISSTIQSILMDSFLSSHQVVVHI